MFLKKLTLHNVLVCFRLAYIKESEVCWFSTRTECPHSVETLDHGNGRVSDTVFGAVLFTSKYVTSFKCMNEYLAIESGGYLCMDCLCALSTE